MSVVSSLYRFRCFRSGLAMLGVEFGEQLEAFLCCQAKVTHMSCERCVVGHEELAAGGVERREDKVVLEVVMDAFVGERAEHLGAADGCHEGLFEHVAHAAPGHLACRCGDVGRDVLSGAPCIELHETCELVGEVFERKRGDVERNVLAFARFRHERAHGAMVRAAREEIVEPDVGVDQDLDGETDVSARGFRHASPHFSSCSAAASSRSSS